MILRKAFDKAATAIQVTTSPALQASMYYFVHRCGSLQPRDHVGKDTQERFCGLTWPTRKLCVQEGTIIHLHLEANIPAITINAPPSDLPCRHVRANGREYRLHAEDHV